MTLEKYSYAKKVNAAKLHHEIVTASGITTALDHISALSNNVDIFMKATLSTAEEVELSSIVTNHTTDPLPSPTQLLDEDGAILTRPKMATLGRHYQLHGMMFTTADEGSLKQPDAMGIDRAYGTSSFYDDSGIQVSGVENMHKVCQTVVDWEPPFDYEIMGGMFHQNGSPNSELILNVVALPDIPASAGGNVEFVLATDLRFIGPDAGLHILGHTTSELKYDPNLHTNKIRMCLHHGSGVQHNMYIGFEIFIGTP